MNRNVLNQLQHAASVVAVFVGLIWFGAPVLFDALAPLASVLWPAGLPSLHAIAATAVMVGVALSAPSVYRRILTQEAKERELFVRSLSITGQLPQ